MKIQEYCIYTNVKAERAAVEKVVIYMHNATVNNVTAQNICLSN